MVRVPATIIQSDCLGLGLKIIPNRSRSYLAAPVCIISTAQQARPNVMGQMEPRRAQFMRSSTLEITNSAVLDSPGGEEVDGGRGREYGVGVEVAAAVEVEERDGRVVWRAAVRDGVRCGRRVAAVRERSAMVVCRGEREREVF